MSRTNTNRDHHHRATASLDDMLGSQWRTQLGHELTELADARAASAVVAKKTFM